MSEHIGGTSRQHGHTPSRRSVLRAGGAVAAVGAVGVGAAAPSGADHPAAVAATPGVLDVYVNEGFVPMVDGSLVYMRGFGDRPTVIDDPAPSLTLSPRVFTADGGLHTSRQYPLDAEVPPHEGRPDPLAGPDADGVYEVRGSHWASLFPARTIVAETGTRVRLQVHNGLSGVHALHVHDVAGTGPIAAGASASLEFDAPAAGTYLISDDSSGVVERILGLHAVLVVMPADAPWLLSSGEAEFERQWLWICQDVDPVWARRAQVGERIDPVATPPVPRYFLLNDRSGYASLGLTTDDDLNRTRHEESLASGYPRDTDVRDFGRNGGRASGQLIRLVNAGVVVHQMHFHGNHVWTVRRNGRDFPRDGRLGAIDEDGHIALQQWEDVVELDPLDRKEIVLPMRRPPDALDAVWAARTDDWHFPMHCHAEPSQTAAGGLYPGGLVADWVLGGERSPKHHSYRSQVEFATNQPKDSNPVTEFRGTPDRRFLREFYSRELEFPDGSAHEMWSFEDESSGRSFPAPLLRMTEGELVHLELKSSKRVHTIHLHGMEPDPRNDGVGHTSFEITGRYTYQWRPAPGTPGDPNHGAAGSYFYHCHVNTVLHVQMGMVGPMIIDPVVHPDHPVPPGTRRPFVDGPPYDIDSELMLVPYSLDPRWHELSHAAGVSGEDVGLNRFDPKHFFVLGGRLAGGQPVDQVWSAGQLRANASGFPTLLRVLNLNYVPTRVRFTTADSARSPVPMAELIAHDGRALRDTRDPVGVSRLPRDLGNKMATSALMFGAAERYDMLLAPPAPGEYLIHFDWFDWVDAGNRRVLATRTLPLTAS